MYIRVYVHSLVTYILNEYNFGHLELNYANLTRVEEK